MTSCIFVAVVGFTITLVDIDAIISVNVEFVASIADAVVGAESIAASCMSRTAVGVCSTLVYVFADKPVAHVLESDPAFACERARVISTVCLRTARHVLDALIDVVAVAVHSVPSPADVAVAFVATDVICASSIDITVVIEEQDCSVALVNVGASYAVAVVTNIACAVE